jgi:endonuclease-8
VPEGDTIHRAAAALRAALLGKPLTAFEAPRLVGPKPAPGVVIEEVRSRGKHLDICFDDGLVLHTHMRMTGSWHLYRPGEQWRRSHHQARVVLEVPGFLAVCFSAPVVEVFRAADPRRHAAFGTLGPDLSRPDADLAACVDRMAHFCLGSTSIAEALLDQRVACGVGNVYKAEVLWACGLDPFTPVEAVPVLLRHRLLATASRMLQANLTHPARITLDVPGGLAVYGRHGAPCFRCGTPVAVRRHGELARVTYWCPGCQTRPGEAPPPRPPAPAPPRRRTRPG